MMTALWSVAGIFRLAGRQVAWWHLTEQSELRSLAVVTGDSREWRSLHKTGQETRKVRGLILLAELAAVTAACAALAVLAPWPAQALTAAAVVPWLARYGHGAGRRITGTAVVEPRFRKLSADVCLRAYYAAKLGDPEKDGQQIRFATPMCRDMEGSRVTIDLPHGRGFRDALNARAQIASGLDVKIQQVYLTEDPTSERRHVLWVADRDPLALPAGRAPLLDCRPRSIWQPAQFGLDERGRKVTLMMMWVSILVGAQPRKGKTFSARLLALHAAADPHVKLTVADGKNSPDWRAFRLVAHRLILGTQATRDGDPVQLLIAALREIKEHIESVNVFLSTLPASECPEGKLTEALSRKYARLRVWLLVMEEFQVYFELEDQKVNQEIAGLLSFIMAVGPSAGVIILSSSQKPSGVGAGDVQRLFNRYRDNHVVRFALKCGSRVASEAILGGDAYSEGFDASALPVGPAYRGVGYLYGAADETPVVRCYLADAQDAEKILLAARAHRERAGLLTGMAVGEEVPETPDADVLADVLAVLNAAPALHWEPLAQLLRSRFPERHADATAESVSAMCRAAGVPSVDVRYLGRVRKGCRRSDVEAATL